MAWPCYGGQQLSPLGRRHKPRFPASLSGRKDVVKPTLQAQVLLWAPGGGATWKVAASSHGTCCLEGLPVAGRKWHHNSPPPVPPPLPPTLPQPPTHPHTPTRLPDASPVGVLRVPCQLMPSADGQSDFPTATLRGDDAAATDTYNPDAIN